VIAVIFGIVLSLTHETAAHLPMVAQIAISVLILLFVFWCVFVVLGHAEAVAHRIGEPYGTLVLTIAITAIEASVIISVMLHGETNPTIARESVFSTVMIVCGGVVGLSLLLGGWRHRYQQHKQQATSALLAVVIALSVLTLVLPNYTLANNPGDFSALQLVFVSLLCLMLYASFVFAQMTRHRADFLDDDIVADDSHAPAARPGLARSLVLLLVGLIGIVLLAEHVAASLEQGLSALALPQTDAIVGAFIATLVLLPETVAAIRAAQRNQLQRALNIALGSACATIGLTIPVVAAASLITGHDLTLGLGPGDTVLLLLALGVSLTSFGTGRTTMLTGLVHLVVFVAYLLLIIVP
jgi:Ca2+:H+ antiporter